jgi:hypothetical protein
MKVDDDMAEQIRAGTDSVTAGNVAGRVYGLQMQADGKSRGQRADLHGAKIALRSPKSS